ncbi:MAG: hypothetical protein ACRD3Q_19430 [Terriglobales bacterium]
MKMTIRRELRLLKAYVGVSTILFGVLIFVAAKPSQKAKFEEIDAERINIVENGKLRLAISNNERSPGPIIGGHYMKTREGKRGAGFIFFNDEGDECGGMTWEGKKENGKISADSGFMFDQYDQDQTVGITYHQSGDDRSSGLHVWERSLTPMGPFAKKVEDIELMPDGDAKTEAMKKLREEAVAGHMGGIPRVFVGRDTKNNATVTLSDTKGKPRIVMSVYGSDVASLQFLDDNGKTVYSLPAKPGNQ